MGIAAVPVVARGASGALGGGMGVGATATSAALGAAFGGAASGGGATSGTSGKVTGGGTLVAAASPGRVLLGGVAVSVEGGAFVGSADDSEEVDSAGLEF